MKLYRRRLKRSIKRLFLINCFKIFLILPAFVMISAYPDKVFAKEATSDEINAEEITVEETTVEEAIVEEINKAEEIDEIEDSNTPAKRVTVYEDCLKVNAVREDGINIILGTDVYYTNCNIMLAPANNQETYGEISVYEYAAGYDRETIANSILEGVENLDDEIDYDDSMYQIIPTDGVIIDINKLNEGINYYISFRGIDRTNEETIIYYSQIYCICKDTTPPKIDFYSEKELDKWSNEPIPLRIGVSDIGSLHCFKAVSDGAVIEEVLYDNLTKVRSSIREITLISEAYGINGNNVEVICSDKAGNESRITQRYYIDYSAPGIEINGPEKEVNNGDVSVGVKWSDTMMDTTRFYYSVSREYQGHTFLIEDNTVASSDLEGVIKRNYSLDGEYHINCFAYDLAGNKSETGEISFRIDTYAPVVLYDGVTDGGKYKSDVNIGIYINDEFYEDMRVNVTGFRELGGDTKILALESMKEHFGSNRSTYKFSDDGVYRIEIRATDAAGNNSEAVFSFKIDKTAPKVTLLSSNAIDGILTNRYPTLNFNVYEMFYDTTEIDIGLYRTEGDKYIKMPYNKLRMNSEKYSFPVVVKDEGDYELIIRATDECGSCDEYRIRFAVDVTPPIIGFLDEISMKYLGKFVLPEEFGNYIHDRNNVSYRAYLNSDNYVPGTFITKTGKYYLRIEAVDEAGNKSDRTVEFIVDSDRPEIEISGLRKDGSARINSEVMISLRNPQDYITYYSVNGVREELDEKINHVNLTPKRLGKYELHIKAEDLAGNVSEDDVVIRCSALGGLTDERTERKMTINAGEKIIEKGHTSGDNNAEINEPCKTQDPQEDDNFPVILFSLYSIIGPIGKGIKKILNNT